MIVDNFPQQFYKVENVARQEVSSASNLQVGILYISLNPTLYLYAVFDGVPTSARQSNGSNFF